MFEIFKKYSKWATLFVLGVALIAVYKTFDSFDVLISGIKYVFGAIEPFIIAFVIAYLLNIPVKKLDWLISKKPNFKRLNKYKRAISISLVNIVFIAVVVIVLSLILPALYRNVLDMYSNLPAFVGEISAFINNIELLEKIGFQPSSMDISSMLYDIVNPNAIGKYAQGLMSFTSGMLDVFIALIASVYMLIEKDRIIYQSSRLIRLFVKSDKAEGFLARCSRVIGIFTQYIYSRLICCVVMAVVCSIILAIMGERYALLIGMFIGFMDLIPYFGSIISWVVGAIVMTISGGLWHSVWCSLIILVMQQLDGNVLAPKVMGDRLEISPLAIIIAVSVGGSLFGFVGMVISVPIVAIIRLIFSEIIEAKENEQNSELHSAQN